MPNYGALPPVGRNLVNQRGGARNANSENILPGKIKCHVCQKLKPHSEYAKRQLTRHKESIFNPYAPGGRSNKDPKTTCRSCTPAQTAELTCCICHKTKGLDGFAKNQRRVPKNPRCIKCVENHLETEPGLDMPSSDDSDTDGDDEDFDNPTVVVRRVHVPRIAAPQPTGNVQKQPKGLVSKAQMEDSDSDDDDGWESVQKPKPSYASRASQPHSGARNDSRGSSRSSSVNQTQVTKSGWARVKKTPQANVDPQIDEAEHDEWSAYSRNLKGRRSGPGAPEGSGNKNKKFDDNDFDDDDW